MTADSHKNYCVVCGSIEITIAKKFPKDFEYGVVPKTHFMLLRCNTCESEFLSPRPAENEIASYYPDHYHAYNEDHGVMAAYLVSLRSRARARNFLARVSNRPVRVFDVGAGDCRHFDAIKTYGDFHCSGVELNKGMAEKSCSRGYNVTTGTLEGMDISGHEGKYHIVTMYQLVEHVLDPLILMNKAFRLLAPGGWVMGQLPCVNSLEHKLFGRYWAGYHFPRHLQMVSRQGMEILLQRAAFSNIRVSSALHLQAGLSLQNIIIGKLGYQGQMRYGKISAYSLLLLAVAPFCIAEHLMGKGGMMNFKARKPDEAL